jgi:hypothetical protein
MTGLPPAVVEKPSGAHEAVLKTWPVVLTVLTALCYLLGYIHQHSYAATLGITALRNSVPKEQFIIDGLMVLLSLIYPSAVAVGLVLLIHFVLNSLFGPDRRHLSTKILGLLRSAFHKSVPPAWRPTALAIWAFFLASTLHVLLVIAVQWSRGLPLEHAPTLGGPAMQLLWEQTDNAGWGVLELVSVTITAVTTLLGWASTRIQNIQRRAVFSLVGILLCVALIFDYTQLAGFTDTITTYPVVGFAGQQDLVGKESMMLLLGSDEQQYALLAVMRPGAGREDAGSVRGIIYLPKKDIKWLSVFGHFQLYRLAHLYDYYHRPEK